MTKWCLAEKICKHWNSCKSITLCVSTYHWCPHARLVSSHWRSWRGYRGVQPSDSGSGLSRGSCRCRWRGALADRSVSRSHTSAHPLWQVCHNQQLLLNASEKQTNLQAIRFVVCAPGLDTTMSMQLGLYLTICGMMDLKTLTFLCTRLRRLSPSCWRTPAVTTTIREFAVTA